MLLHWFCRLSLAFALLLAAGDSADRLPKGQVGGPDSVRALEVTAVFSARQGVAIVKLERSTFSAKAVNPLEGATFQLASLQRRSDHIPVVHRYSVVAPTVSTRHKAYRARPPPLVTTLFT